MTDKTSSRIDGSAFTAPSPADLGITSAKAITVWFGALPGCPTARIVAGGLGFVHVTEKLIRKRGADRKSEVVRIPRRGDVATVTKAQLERIQEDLRHQVIRMTEQPTVAPEPEIPGVQNVGDPIQRPGVGKPIRIPKKADVEAREKQGRGTRPYIPEASDEPAARYLYMIPIPDGGQPGDYFPDPLEVTGFDLSVFEDDAPAPQAPQAPSVELDDILN